MDKDILLNGMTRQQTHTVKEISPKPERIDEKNNLNKKGKTKQGRPSTKKGKKLTKYSMDIHPELKRAVVKAAAIYDKNVHVMWNEIIFNWLTEEKRKHPDWYTSIKVEKNEL